LRVKYIAAITDEACRRCIGARFLFLYRIQCRKVGTVRVVRAARDLSSLFREV